MGSRWTLPLVVQCLRVVAVLVGVACLLWFAFTVGGLLVATPEAPSI
jgi:hypothetical protein